MIKLKMHKVLFMSLISANFVVGSAYAADKCDLHVKQNEYDVSKRDGKWAQDFVQTMDRIDMEAYRAGDYSEYFLNLNHLYEHNNPAAITLVGYLSYYECFDFDNKYPNSVENLKRGLQGGEKNALSILDAIARKTENEELFSEGVSIGRAASSKFIRSEALALESSGIVSGKFPKLGSKNYACKLAKKAIRLDPSSKTGHGLVGYCYGELVKRKDYAKAYYHLMLSGADKEEIFNPILDKYKDELSVKRLKKIERKINRWNNKYYKE